MSDVSCRAFRLYQRAAQQGLIDLDEFLGEGPLSRALLERPAMRVPWSDWAELSDRLAARLPREVFIATGGLTLDAKFVGPLFRLSRLFIDMADVYVVGMEWVGPSMYRCVDFRCEVRSGQVVVEARLQPGYRPCESWFLNMVGALRSVPPLYGKPPAPVNYRVDGTAGHYEVLLPEARYSPWRRLKTLATAVRTPSLIARELSDQQTQITVQLDQLRRREAEFARVLETLPGAVALSRGGVISWANAELARLAGADAALLRGRRLADVIEPLEASAEGRGYRRYRVARADGSHSLLEGRTLHDIEFEGAQVDGLFGVDVSSLASARAALARSEATLEAIVGAMPDHIIRVDARGTVRDVLGGTELPEELTRDLVVGAPIQERLVALATPSAHDEVREAAETLARAIAAREQRSVELPLATSPPRTLEGRVAPLPDSAQSIVLLRDVTERVQAARTARLRERLEALSALTAGISHELNNPLTYVLANYDLLHDAVARLDLDDEARAGFSDMGEGLARMSHVLRALRSLSATDVTDLGPVDVDAAAENALTLVERQIALKAQVVRDFGHPPRALAAQEPLQHALLNLLLNAMQAIPPGAPANHRVVVRTARDGERVIVEVSDTGHGMTKATRDRIFDPFFSTRPVGEGSGLGLSIALSIVRRFGGELHATSAVGAGTSFRLVLQQAAAEAPRSTPAPLASAARASILLLDDEPLLLELWTTALAGHQVVAFTSADETLAHLALGHRPDVIVCDIMMPHMTGPEFYDATRRLAPELAGRFQFVTAGAFTKETAEFVRAHQADVMLKPFRSDELRAAIARRLRARPDVP